MPRDPAPRFRSRWPSRGVFLPWVRLLALAGLLGCTERDAAEPAAITEDAGEEPPEPIPVEDASAPVPLGCANGSAIEAENNDAPARANAFQALTFCGVLETADDVDYATFETPPNTKLGAFQAVVNGPVEFELTLGGVRFGPSDTQRFGSGRYLVKAFTRGGTAANYRMRLQFDPT